MPFVGENQSRSGGFTETKEYDPNRYKYGGQPGGAEAERANLAVRQHGVEGRTGPQINQGPQNETRGMQMGSLSRLDSAAGGQTEDMRLLSGAANGTAPSKAEILGQQMSDRALRSQVSAAGTVRGGPGASAAAYRSAAQGAASQRADMNAGIQAGRADEMATARGQLSNAMSGARRDAAGATTAARGQDIGLATDQAKIDQNQTALNDARAQQYEGLQNKVATDQLNADTKQQEIAAGYKAQSNALNQKTAQANADKDTDLFKGAVGAAGGILGGALKVFSDEEAKLPVLGSLGSLGGDNGGSYGASKGTGAATSDPSSGSAYALSGGGGMDVGSTIMQQASTATGQPMQLSDMRGKYTPSDMSGKTGNVMLSPGEAKVPADLEAGMLEGTEGATPYAPDPNVNMGAAGVRRGYAADRNVPPPDDDDGPSWTKPDEFGMKKAKKGEEKDFSQMAPGSEDWERYGEAAKKEGDPDWKRGGATKPKEKKASAWETLLKGGLGGIDRWANPQPVYVRDTTTSDEAAKRAAFESGAAYATKHITGEKMEPWTKEKAKADDKDRDDDDDDFDVSKSPDFKPADSPHPLPGPPPAPMARSRNDQLGAPFFLADIPRAPGAREAPAPAAPTDAVGFSAQRPEAIPSRARYDGPAASRGRKRETSSSDEKAKQPTKGMGEDYGHRTAMYSMDKALAEKAEQKAEMAEDERKTFERHDNDAETRRVKRKIQDQAGKDADAIMAGMRDSLKRGASVSKYEGEVDDKGFVNVPDEEMAEAMRSMQARPYAYKEGLRPPEQKPGEVNVGPMANDMAEDDVAGTAIVKDPKTNLLAIDKDKAMKVTMGSLASLQHQIDDLKDDVPRAVRAKKQRRREPASA